MVVPVQAVDIAGQSRPLADRAEGELPQPADFPHHAGSLIHAAEIDLPAVPRLAQPLGALRFPLDQLAVFRVGDGFRGLE